MKLDNIIAVLDIGSTKVCCCIAHVFNNGSYKIIGAGYCACFGVKSGIIVDIESAKKSITVAVESAEKMANVRIKSVYVNISGKNVETSIINVSLNIGGRIIKNGDIVHLLSYSGEKNGEKEVIHSIPVLYSVDSLNGIKNPIGMIADKLNVHLNLVTAPKAQLNNLQICLAHCHLDTAGIVASIYAAGLYLIDKNEAMSNQIVIDLGGETTSIGFFYNGIFSGMKTIPFGGENITRDIAYGLSTSIANAERLKTLHGAAFVSITDKSDTIFVPVNEHDDLINLQQISKSNLNQIIQPRVREILTIVKDSIGNSIFTNSFSDEIIITGGGSALSGIKDFSGEILNKKIKIKDNFEDAAGMPIGNNFTVALGMIKFAHLSDKKYSVKNKEKRSFIKKTLEWIENNL